MISLLDAMNIMLQIVEQKTPRRDAELKKHILAFIVQMVNTENNSILKVKQSKRQINRKGVISFMYCKPEERDNCNFMITLTELSCFVILKTDIR